MPHLPGRIHLTRVAIFVLACLMGAAAMAAAKPDRLKRVVLVGASIGQNWHFDRISERIALPGYRFEYQGVRAFDKEPLIRRLSGSADKPDIVLIKECNSYFPGNFEDYQRRVIAWVDVLRAAGIQPVLVTTPPIAESGDYVLRAKNLVKRIIGRQTTFEGIVQFNDWMKSYAGREHIPVFDMEASLRRSDSERWMRSEYDYGDTEHLNARAYQVLDEAFARFLSSGNIR